MSDTPSRHLSHSTFGIVRILLARRNLEAEQADQLLGWEAGHTQGLLEDPASAALGEFFDLFQLALGDFEPSGPNPHALPRSFYSDPTFHRAPLQPSNSLPEDEATRHAPPARIHPAGGAPSHVFAVRRQRPTWH